MAEKTTDGEIAVITELLTILSKYDPSVIEAARHRAGISENLRTALHALAREAKTNHGNMPVTRLTGSDDLGTSRPRLSLEMPQFEYRKQLTGYLSDAQNFPDKQSLLKLARSLKINMPPDRRDNRARVASKLARAISAQKKAREQLSQLMASNQTSGWFDVILDQK